MEILNASYKMLKCFTKEFGVNLNFGITMNCQHEILELSFYYTAQFIEEALIQKKHK